MDRRDIKWLGISEIPPELLIIYIDKTDEWVIKIKSTGPHSAVESCPLTCEYSRP